LGWRSAAARIGVSNTGVRKLATPKGKLPYINDDGLIVADSTFIRFQIEKKYGFDFDSGLTQDQRAGAWAAEKMCEEHLYWALVATRWLEGANFAKGPAQFFKAVPMPFRPIVQGLIRRKVEKTLKIQGFWRHTRAERDGLVIADLNALASLLGGKDFLMGEKPCGADATVFAFALRNPPRSSLYARPANFSSSMALITKGLPSGSPK
jgi:glutathione S-transferase